MSLKSVSRYFKLRAGDGAAMAMNADGTLIAVTNAVNHTVSILNADTGKLRCVFGGEGSKPGQLNTPAKLCFEDNAEEHVIVADKGNKRLQKFTLLGQFVDAIELTDEYGFGNVVGVHAHGGIVACVCPSEAKGGLQVGVFAPDQKLVGMFGGFGEEPGRLNKPYDIVVCNDTMHVVIAEYGAARVSVFTATGQFLRTFSGEAGVIRPTGLCMLPGVSVVAVGHDRIVKLPQGVVPSGPITIEFDHETGHTHIHHQLSTTLALTGEEYKEVTCLWPGLQLVSVGWRSANGGELFILDQSRGRVYVCPASF